MAPRRVAAIVVQASLNCLMVAISMLAKAEEYRRYWSTHVTAAEVRSVNGSSCCSLIRFSMSPPA